MTIPSSKFSFLENKVFKPIFFWPYRGKFRIIVAAVARPHGYVVLCVVVVLFVVIWGWASRD